MIELFTGLPGAGKSYVVCVEGLERLELSDMHLVGNFAWHLDELNSYVQRPGRRFVDVFHRVRTITREECAEFWRFRGNFTVLPGGSMVGMRTLLRTRDAAVVKELQKAAVETLSEILVDLENEGRRQPPVCYIIDEAHVLFDARSWQNTSAALTFYNSQHRKLGDDVLFVTQFLQLIEKRVRGFVERYHVMRNWIGASVMKVLRMPARIRELVYYVEPAKGMESDREIWRKLDLEKANCYDTMAGVGIRGGRPPEIRKHKGFALPWWSVFGGIAALAFGVWWVSQHGTGLLMGRFMKAPVLPVPAAVGAVSAFLPAGPLSGQSLPPVRSGLDPTAPAASVKLPVYVKGYVKNDKHIMVTLSDGRTLTDADGIRYVTTSEVVLVNGTHYPFRRLVPDVPMPLERAVSVPVVRIPAPSAPVAKAGSLVPAR